MGLIQGPVRNVTEGDGEYTEIEYSSRNFALIIDGQRYEPFVCQEIEVESDGDMSKTGTQCGGRKQRQTADDPFSVMANGVIGKDMPSGYLEPRHLLFDVNEGDEVYFTSDFPFDGPVEVSNVLVRQTADTPTIQLEGERYIAFEWQIQLGGQSSGGSG
jgi:hypothetical protein